MCSGQGDWTCLQPGFPIRKSTDHSLVIDSPWLIADSYVLLRFLVPRHPPCALKNLTHKDARVHCVVLKIRAEPHHTPPPNHNPNNRSQPVREQARPTLKNRAKCPSLQDPTTCQTPPPSVRHFPQPNPKGSKPVLTTATRAAVPNNRCSTLEQPPQHVRP